MDKETKEEKWWEAVLTATLTAMLIVSSLFLLRALQLAIEVPGQQRRITREIKACNSCGCQIDGEFEEGAQ